LREQVLLCFAAAVVDRIYTHPKGQLLLLLLLLFVLIDQCIVTLQGDCVSFRQWWPLYYLQPPAFISHSPSRIELKISKFSNALN